MGISKHGSDVGLGGSPEEGCARSRGWFSWELADKGRQGSQGGGGTAGEVLGGHARQGGGQGSGRAGLGRGGQLRASVDSEGASWVG